MRKLSEVELINEVWDMKAGDTIVVEDGQDVGLTTTISKIDFLDNEIILVGGYFSPISSYQIFDNLPEESQGVVAQCVDAVFSFFREDVEDLQEVVLVRRGNNSLSFTV